jgi:hypothetical protein
MCERGTWASCPEHRPRDRRPSACCVHVEDCSQGFDGQFLSFFCCWCGTAVAYPQSPVPPLPAAYGGGDHGPFAARARTAHPSDLRPRPDPEGG